MQKFIQTTAGRICLHIIFWVFYFGMESSIYGFARNNFWQTFSGYLMSLPAYLSSVYFTLYVLLPFFLFKRKFLQFVVYLILSALFFTFIYRLLQYHIIFPKLYPHVMERFEFWSAGYFSSLISMYMVVALASALKLLRYWYENQQIQQMLINQNVQSEIALLRSQVNPHFLFNTLNNIDSLIVSAPKKASDSIVRLADIMRYMLYDSNAEIVPLEKEIDYLHSYINLQLLRLRNQKFVELEITGDVSGKLIAPMLLVPFVENAFKHGDKSKSPGIIIKIIISNEKLQLWVTNFISDDLEKNRDQTGGVGLTNVKRRLELMYKDNYFLDIKNDIQLKQFLVHMEVNIQIKNNE
jgi:two-component system, LytTR family, sensor kinase